ncbi:MAG: hypothetical protein ACOYED_04225 [Peptococcia bacterium]|jgi:hypothetical protein
MPKLCVLDENKLCDNCSECNYCDLDSTKICDNCCECLDEGDYRAIKITDIITDPEKATVYK